MNGCDRLAVAGEYLSRMTDPSDLALMGPVFSDPNPHRLSHDDLHILDALHQAW